MVLRVGDPIVESTNLYGPGFTRGIEEAVTSSGVAFGAVGSVGPLRGLTRGVTSATRDRGPRGGETAGPRTPAATGATGPRVRGPAHLDRRRLLAAAAVAGGAAWVAPVVMSMNAPAAANSGICTGPPSFVGYAEARAIGNASNTSTKTLTPSGVPISGFAMVHLAVGNVDHIIGMPASYFATPAGWTLLGEYDSDVTTPGTTATGSTANWSQRTYVWFRQVGLSSSYSFDVTFTGDSGYQPQARVVVAAYQQANAVANDPGEIALQGSGVISPLPPLPASAAVQVPSITVDLPNTLAVGLASASNVSSTNSFTPPLGYTTDVTANGGNGYPPIWLFSRLVSAGTLPATTGTVAPGAMNIGGRLTIECG